MPAKKKSASKKIKKYSPMALDILECMELLSPRRRPDPGRSSGGFEKTFTEIQRTIGTDSKGDLMWVVEPNLILWAGMSQAFVNALEELAEEIEPRPSTPMDYALSGVTVKLPTIGNIDKVYQSLHWLPVEFVKRDSVNEYVGEPCFSVEDMRPIRTELNREATGKIVFTKRIPLDDLTDNELLYILQTGGGPGLYQNGELYDGVDEEADDYDPPPAA